MKMANMDHVFDYMFTNPKDSQGVRPQLHKLEICAVVTYLNWTSVCAEVPDAWEGWWVAVFWRRVRWTGRILRVCVVAAALACERFWDDAQRSQWFQTGRFLCCSQRTFWGLLWYEFQPFKHEQNNNLTFNVLIQIEILTVIPTLLVSSLE